MLHKQDFEAIGYIGRTHGIQGEVACKVTVDLSALYEEEERLFLMLEEQGLLIPYAVESFRSKGEEIDLIRFDGITTKEQAEHLVGTALWLSKDYLGDDELSEDPYDFARYVGFTLIDQTKERVLGQVTHVDETTMNTLLYVEALDGTEMILPIAEELLVGYDDEQRTLVVNIPEGLLEALS